MKLSVINKGFSLVEVVVALFILSVSVITIYNLILSTAVSSYDLEQRYLAKEVANNRISLINTIEKSLKPIDRSAIAKMIGDVQKTPEWETVRARNAWVNIYNPEGKFVSFLEKQTEEMTALMKKLGVI